MKLICILEAAQSDMAEEKKIKVKDFTDEIVKFLQRHGYNRNYVIDTTAKIYPCKYKNCPECRFDDLCIRLGTRYADSKKVVIIDSGQKGGKNET